MTVSVNDRRIQYTATAGQTIFPYDFKIDANTEISILHTVNATGVTTTLTLTTDYSVSGVGDDAGGNITLVNGAAVDDTITIVGNTPLTRVTDFNQAGDFLVSDLNNQLDKLTHILQENSTTINRTVKLKDEDTTSILEIPTATNRASKFLGFNSSGDAIALAGTTEVAVSSFMETVLDDADSKEALTTLSSGLTEITTLQDADQFIVADNSDSDNSKKITKANFLASSKATTTNRGVTYLNKPITIANNSTDADHDIDFSAGNFNFDDGSGQAVATALTKQLDATWAAGDNAGGLFTGSIAADTWYHCFAIWNPATQTYDAGFDTDINAANAPSGYTKYERRGGILTDGSGNIYAFTQTKDYFEFNSIILETTSTHSDALFTVSSPLGISTKVNVYGRVTNYTSADSNISCGSHYVGSSNITIADNTDDSNNRVNYGEGLFITNNSSEIYLSITASGSSNRAFYTRGWIDYQLKF